MYLLRPSTLRTLTLTNCNRVRVPGTNMHALRGPASVLLCELNSALRVTRDAGTNMQTLIAIQTTREKHKNSKMKNFIFFSCHLSDSTPASSFHFDHVSMR